MRIQIKGSEYDLPPKVTAYTKRKVGSLAKYTGHTGPDEAFAYVDLGKASGAHHSGRIWRADINFDVHGARFHATAVEEHIEEAIDTAVGEVRREVREAHSRGNTLMRHGGALLKAMMRGTRS